MLLLGLCLAVCYLLLYAVLVVPSVHTDPLLQAWEGQFPWLVIVYQLADLPIHYLTDQPWVRIGPGGYANATLLLLATAMLLTLLAAWIGRRAGSRELSARGQSLLFWTVIVLTALFAVLFFWSPITLSVWTRDLLQSWLVGRLVINQHANPYTMGLASIGQDTALAWLQQTGIAGSWLSIGPVWADISILITQVAPDNAVAVVLGLRLIGLGSLLVSAWLIWAILARLKPEWRICGVIVFAWNPLVLQLGVGQAHHEILVVMIVLLAVFFLLRETPLLGWCFVLLASLLDLSLLILLPLFLRFLQRETRFMGWFWRACWWLSLLVLSALILVLAYLPYWQGWGLNGALESVRQVFWQEQAVNSLLAALQGLSLHLPGQLAWLLASQSWSILLLGVLLLGLIFSLWLIDSLELLLFCASWLLLLFAILHPVYWPWLLLLPLALALCSTGSRTSLLAILLLPGGLVCYYCWLWHPVWTGQGLLAIGVPFLLWGWISFFIATWHMARGQSAEDDEEPGSTGRPRRPPWFSRPWPSRPGTQRPGR